MSALPKKLENSLCQVHNYMFYYVKNKPVILWTNDSIVAQASVKKFTRNGVYVAISLHLHSVMHLYVRTHKKAGQEISHLFCMITSFWNLRLRRQVATSGFPDGSISSSLVGSRQTLLSRSTMTPGKSLKFAPYKVCISGTSRWLEAYKQLKYHIWRTFLRGIKQIRK